VHRVRDQLLSGAILALDENVRLAGRTLSTSSKSSCIFLALSDHVLELVAVLQLRLQLLVLVDEGLLLDRLLELVEETLGSIGFSRKSNAPALTPRPSAGMLPWPVMTMTSASGSSCLNFLTSSMPSTSGSIMSVITESGCQALKTAVVHPRADERGPHRTGVLEQDFEPLGHRRLVIDGENTLLRLMPGNPDSVITDMMLPDVDGIELVRKFKQLDPEAEVIVITGQGNIPRSVEAVKAGAFDFLEKPIDAERLLDKLEKAIKQKALVDENEQLKAKLQDRYKFQNVIGKSKKMQELFELVESVAASEANILIQGENGTGRS